MGGSTLELVFLAVFGLVTLFQFVRNFLRGKAAKARQAQQALNPRNAQAGGATTPSADEPLSTAWGRTVEEATVPVGPPPEHTTQIPRAPVPPRPTAAPWQPGPADAARSPYAQNALGPMRRARRFSRAALMGDRRAVQDAVVIAAILRPCHAHKPYEMDG